LRLLQLPQAKVMMILSSFLATFVTPTSKLCLVWGCQDYKVAFAYSATKYIVHGSSCSEGEVTLFSGTRQEKMTPWRRQVPSISKVQKTCQQ
jgi:uncharacterized Fe-S cluster protein YjdI